MMYPLALRHYSGNCLQATTRAFSAADAFTGYAAYETVDVDVKLTANFAYSELFVKRDISYERFYCGKHLAEQLQKYRDEIAKPIKIVKWDCKDGYVVAKISIDGVEEEFETSV